MPVSIFWLITVVLIVFALLFLLPPLYLARWRTIPSLLLTVVFSLSVYALYWNLGQGRQMPSFYSDKYIKHRKQQLELRPVFAQAKRELARNRIAVELNADDLQAWVQLGDLHAILQEFENSINAYGAALQLAPNDDELVLKYANSSSRLNGGLLEVEVKDAVEDVLLRQPNRVMALNLLGVHAYKAENYQLAINNWNKILAQFTPEMQKTSAHSVILDKIRHATLKMNNKYVKN